jgi:hypothetical protein
MIILAVVAGTAIGTSMPWPTAASEAATGSLADTPDRWHFARGREVWTLAGAGNACEGRTFESPGGRASYGSDEQGRFICRGSIGPASAPKASWDQEFQSMAAAGAFWQEKVDEIWYEVGGEGWHVFQVDTERGTTEPSGNCASIPTKEFTYFLRKGE